MNFAHVHYLYIQHNISFPFQKFMITKYGKMQIWNTSNTVVT